VGGAAARRERRKEEWSRMDGPGWPVESETCETTINRPSSAGGAIS
jgi:hypothetical protein